MARIRNLSRISTALAFGLVSSATGGAAEASDTAPAHPTGQLNAVTAIGPEDVWAVGYAPSGPSSRTLAMHWDGRKWTPFATPGTDASLADVAGANGDDVWAVGAVNVFSDNLVLHWDGTSWTSVEVPQPPGQYNSLRKVGVVAADDVYATGTYCLGGEGPCYLQTLHWDGDTWTSLQDESHALIRSVDALSPTDAWAVGTVAYDTPTSVAQRWNGHRWRSAKLPRSGQGLWPADVSYVSSDTAWIAGAWNEGDHTTSASVLRWNGHKWREADLAARPFAAVQALSADAEESAWLVGTAAGDSRGHSLQRWDGSQWKLVDSPANRLYNATLSDIHAIAPDDAWAVGSYQEDDVPFRERVVVMHWNGSRWSIAA